MIVGAGLAGLIAAHAMPEQRIAEAGAAPKASHKALLRFRTTAVSELTGITFRRVTVRKGIWLDGRWEQPNIKAANLYATKVLGRYEDRSLWNLESEHRYIPPEDFYERLVAAVSHRIDWNTPVNFAAHAVNSDDPLVSTAPMPVALRAVGIPYECAFTHEPISVERYRVEGCDVHQTVYFPSHEHALYRASISGDLLTCEFSQRMDSLLAPDIVGDWRHDLRMAFALPEAALHPLDSTTQPYGKLAPICDQARRHFITELTNRFNIFSLGRFATWRNILLDDVVHDASVIKRLLNASQYERRLTTIR